MVTQAKKIKTKKGDCMMFATLYDLEASVEIIVFGKALAASEDALATDSIVLVRGKVDHKDRDTTCVIAQQVERFRAHRGGGARGAGAGRQAGPGPSALRCASTPPRCPPRCWASSRTCSRASPASPMSSSS